MIWSEPWGKVEKVFLACIPRYQFFVTVQTGTAGRTAAPAIPHQLAADPASRTRSALAMGAAALATITRPRVAL